MSNRGKVQSMCPYLIVRGGAAAIDFYVLAFGAEEIFRLTDPGDNRIGHAELAIGGQRFFLADEYPDFGAISPDRLGGTTVKFHLEVEDVDGFVEHAVASGAELLRAPKKEFHGYRSALLSDPFGYGWFAMNKVEDVSAEEMQRRWAEVSGGTNREAQA
jgi:PhnB protein